MTDVGSRKPIWTDVVKILIAFAVFGYGIVKDQTFWYFILSVLFLSTIFYLLKDSVLVEKIKLRYHEGRRNRIAKRIFPEFKEHLRRFVITTELARQISDYIEIENPYDQADKFKQAIALAELQNKRHFFSNWYERIMSEPVLTERGNVYAIVRLLDGRFYDFLTNFNSYLSKYETAISIGLAKSKQETSVKQIKQLQTRYDAILDDYNEFCRKVNKKADFLISTYSTPRSLF